MQGQNRLPDAELFGTLPPRRAIHVYQRLLAGVVVGLAGLVHEFSDGLELCLGGVGRGACDRALPVARSSVSEVHFVHDSSGRQRE